MHQPELEQKICNFYNKGFSGQGIAFVFPVSLKYIYKTLHKHDIQIRTPQEQARLRLIDKEPSFDIPGNLSKNQYDLALAALMLYVGEGAKTGNTVDFANSSSLALKLFLRFLREVCHISNIKLKLYLYCFANQDTRELINYWC